MTSTFVGEQNRGGEREGGERESGKGDNWLERGGTGRNGGEQGGTRENGDELGKRGGVGQKGAGGGAEADRENKGRRREQGNWHWRGGTKAGRGLARGMGTGGRKEGLRGTRLASWWVVWGVRQMRCYQM